MKKIKLSDLWKYPAGIRLTIDRHSYWFLEKSKYGYYLFDGYRVILEDRIEGDEDIEVTIHSFSKVDTKKLQEGLSKKNDAVR